MLQLLNRYCWIGQAAPNNTPLWSERGVLAVKGRYPQMYVSTVKYIIVWLNPKNWLKQLFLAPNLTLQVIEWSLITRLYIYFDLLWSVRGYWTSPTLWIKLNYDKYLNYVSNLVALINQTLNFPLIFFFRKKYLIMNCKIYYQYQCLIYVVNHHHISNINQNTAKPRPYQCNVLLNVEMLKWLLITLPSMLRCWHK